MGKVESTIRSLPDHPTKHIYWIVYSRDMIDYMTRQIEDIRGTDYMAHITVVAKGDPSKERTNGLIYFDPTLMDLIGNGRA